MKIFKLPKHFMISECDGGLYDTRKTDWSKFPLRTKYSWSHSDIQTVQQLKATLRAGKFTFPGCYPLFLVMADGEALCFDCGRKEFRLIVEGIRYGTGWKVVGCAANWEDNDLRCCHCEKRIESAYGESKAKESCCDKEDRDINGGCKNCGDPSL